MGAVYYSVKILRVHAPAAPVLTQALGREILSSITTKIILKSRLNFWGHFLFWFEDLKTSECNTDLNTVLENLMNHYWNLKSRYFICMNQLIRLRFNQEEGLSLISNKTNYNIIRHPKQIRNYNRDCAQGRDIYWVEGLQKKVNEWIVVYLTIFLFKLFFATPPLNRWMALHNPYYLDHC